MLRARSRIVSTVLAREALPAALRWTWCAATMRDWLRLLGRELRSHLGDESRPVVSSLFAEALRRRYAVLREQCPHLPPVDQDPRALPQVMAALYQLPLQPRAAWLFDALGGSPRGVEWIPALRLLRPLDSEARWREITTHLGEVLIVLTERLPQRLPRARQIVATMCFEMGARYARRMHGVLDLPEHTPVANAIAVLRVSEYLFRVNPKHETGTDEAERTGFIDGNACPWYARPGWQPGHCGIFGQFQAGVCSEFGLRYRLLTTIPKHGGDHCRVGLEPIAAERLVRR